MRALTVQQPWAWAIVHGGKVIENRSQLWTYRGPLLIHAGKINDPAGFYDEACIAAGVQEPGAFILHGVILGVVDLVDAHRAVDVARLDGTTGHCCEPWGRRSGVHLVLADPRPLPTPVPCRGRLGLWAPDDDLLAAVTQQLRQVA